MAIRDSTIRAPRRKRRAWTRPLAAGTVISKSFAIYFRFFLPITVASALLIGAVIVVDVVAIEGFRETPRPVDAWAEAPESLISNLSAATVGYFLQGVLTFIVLQHLRGRSPGGFGALATGFVRTIRAIPTALVAAVVIGAFTFASNWFGLLASIPAIVVGCGWFVAVPAAATERLGATEALGRSWSLTKGSRWRVFLVQLVFGLIGFGLLVFVMIQLFSVDDPTFEDLRQAVILMHVVTLPMVGLMAVAAPVAYYLLRTGREGIDVEDIASVFD